MVLKLKDKDGKIITYRAQNLGAVLTKGDKTLFLNFKSVNASEKARKIISQNSFNKLFSKGKKIKALGNKVSYIKFERRQ